MQQHQIVVLGAGYAGMLTALRLARKTQAAITLVNAAPVFVERVRLHQQASGQRIVQKSIAELLRGTGIVFVQGLVTRLEPQNRTLHLNRAGSEQMVSYDTLVYALGSFTDRDRVEGVREYADTLDASRTDALHAKLAALQPGARLVICGGGLTGIEAATEMAEAYPQLNVTLVTNGEFAANFSADGRKHIRHTFERLGIGVRDNTTIERLKADQIEMSSGNVAYEVAIWAGAFSVPTLAREGGIQTNEGGQIMVDLHLRSLSHPEIYAAGDSAYPVDLQPAMRMACATALPMGTHVADNIAASLKGEPEKPLEFRYIVRCVSLGRRDGIVQVVEADDRPQERVFTGWLGALLKEMVCRFAFNFVTKERWYLGNQHRITPKAETQFAKALD